MSDQKIPDEYYKVFDQLDAVCEHEGGFSPQWMNEFVGEIEERYRQDKEELKWCAEIPLDIKLKAFDELEIWYKAMKIYFEQMLILVEVVNQVPTLKEFLEDGK